MQILYLHDWQDQDTHTHREREKWNKIENSTKNDSKNKNRIIIAIYTILQPINRRVNMRIMCSALIDLADGCSDWHKHTQTRQSERC